MASIGLLDNTRWDLPDSPWTEEERRQSAHQPVAQREVRRSLATTTKNDQLLLEHEILGDHGAHATGATQLRSHNGEVQQGDQEVLHARVSVGQTPGATQRCPIRESARELAIRDPQATRIPARTPKIQPDILRPGEFRARLGISWSRFCALQRMGRFRHLESPVSVALFERQPESYRESVLPPVLSA